MVRAIAARPGRVSAGAGPRTRRRYAGRPPRSHRCQRRTACRLAAESRCTGGQCARFAARGRRTRSARAPSARRDCAARSALTKIRARTGCGVVRARNLDRQRGTGSTTRSEMIARGFRVTSSSPCMKPCWSLQRFEGDGDTALVSVIVGSQNIGEPVRHQLPGAFASSARHEQSRRVNLHHGTGRLPAAHQSGGATGVALGVRHQRDQADSGHPGYCSVPRSAP